jgi:phosphatidylinositol alpha-mannosyltransferase
MNIGMVCPYDMIMHAGGVQECVHALQVELNRRGHKVTVITPLPQNFDGIAPPGTIFVGRSKRIKTPQHTSTDVAISTDLASIDQLLSDQQFDIIHIHEPLAPFLSMQILPRINCPVVGTFHAASPETMLAKTMAGSIGLYVKSILKYLKTITAVSPAATTYIDHYKHSPVTYIPNGIDLKLYYPTADNTKSDKQTIVYIGRLEARKGVKYLLKAYAQVAQNHSNVNLVIAGDGPDKLKLEKFAVDQALPRVRFQGFISMNDKIKLLQHASLFSAPALYGESFGIVLLEAMACGIPVVAGDNPGYASVLKDSGRLSLVNPEDTPAFSRQLELMLEDEHLRGVWRQWALKTVKNYEYGKVVDKYEAVYDLALRKTKS